MPTPVLEDPTPRGTLMKKPLIGAFSALLLAGATVPAAAATAPAPAAVTVNFAGTVALSDCSGSVVRMPNSAPNDPALVLTNGHCLETGMPSPGEVIVDQPSNRSFTLLSSSGGRLGTLRASKVAYSTMTDTDVTLYQLTTSYAS